VQDSLFLCRLFIFVQSHLELPRKETWKRFEVKFPRPLKKGEETSIEVIFDLEDTEKESIPVLSSSIVEPTETLILKVVIPDDCAHSHIVKQVLQSSAATKPLEIETDTFKDNEYIWTLNNPEISKCYMLQWDWLE
jgi:hypothetical protein